MTQAPPPFTVEHFFLALGLGEEFPPIGVQDSLEKRYLKPNWEGVVPTFKEANVIQPFHHHPAINLALEEEAYNDRFTSKAETTENPAGRKRKRKPPNLSHNNSTSTITISSPDHLLPIINQQEDTTKSRKEMAKESKHWKKYHTKQRKAESKQRVTQQWTPDWF